MRLLIVDDEPIIVNGLVALFEEAELPGVEVYRASSAQEALDWLDKTKIDLVLTDIQMPGLSGLELQREIRHRWPKCKIIFLTGYDDFSYARQAIRQGSEDYLLKTDGFDTILERVGQTLERVREENLASEWMERATSQYRAALPELRRNYLNELLSGSLSAKRQAWEQFERYGVPLSPELPVLLLLGRVDRWREGMSDGDSELFLFAFRNIADEWLSPKAKAVSLPHERNKAVWLIQPRPSEGGDGDWAAAHRFVRGTLESVQESCRRLLQLSVSFALADEPVVWREADGKFAGLKSMLSFGLGSDSEILLTEGDTAAGKRGVPFVNRSRLRQIDLLKTYLESGQEEPCRELLESLLNVDEIPPLLMESYRMEVFHTLAAAFISYLNRIDLDFADRSGLDLSLLSRWDAHGSWDSVRSYFLALSDVLFRRRTDERNNRERVIAAKVQKYIHEHLSGDLTLVQIGEAVGLNPSYLSRLYKQTTGKGLSDEIAEARIARAKELLSDSMIKIHEIPKRIGLTSEHYFYKFFKRSVHMTPQEYRDAAAAGRM
ncbi:response regulator [Cohnella hongkongensis]|uniref:Response regulator n=1 Tax=Cohnella hongkongensis TaxID=178337 RepID=A0ABV9FC64_9BACL